MCSGSVWSAGQESPIGQPSQAGRGRDRKACESAVCFLGVCSALQTREQASDPTAGDEGSVGCIDIEGPVLVQHYWIRVVTGGGNDTELADQVGCSVEGQLHYNGAVDC
ncbi:hypothetical protein UPYG_G00032570 [Umbra pygmaea]|uniref:Uncharacterized protein n=1 Tax=Umbra pygmaea TaxID=75934 RepID=A0ABD0YC51_UMBPY